MHRKNLSNLRLASYLSRGSREKAGKGQVTTSGTLPETTRGDRDRIPKGVLHRLKPAISGGQISGVRTLTDSVSFEFKFTMGVSSLSDSHCRMSKRIEESTFTERHFPYSMFRIKLSAFDEHARVLFNDTMVNSFILLVP